MNEVLPEPETTVDAEIEGPPELRWPQIAAEDGHLYSFADPRRPDERMIGMTLATWMELKQSLDEMTDKLRSAQSANIELALKYQRAMESKTQKQIILTPARGMKIPD